MVLGHHYPDSFAENIALTFARMGVRTTTVDPRGLLRADSTRRGRGVTGRWPRVRNYLQEAARHSSQLQRVVEIPVISALDAAEPHLVLSTDAYLPSATLERWRKFTPGATWVLWYPDSLVNLGPQDSLIAPWDHLFFKDSYLVTMLRSRAETTCHYLPEACNPLRHRPAEAVCAEEKRRYSCDVAIAGNIYPYRSLILETLPQGVDLRLYGNLDRRIHSPVALRAFRSEYVTGRAKALAYGEAKVVLNTLHYGEICSVNARLFEATGCGAFVITHDSPVLQELFQPGLEVVAVGDAASLRAAIERYVDDASARHAIAEAGRRRAHRDHTYERRLGKLLRTCELGNVTQIPAAEVSAPGLAAPRPLTLRRSVQP